MKTSRTTRLKFSRYVRKARRIAAQAKNYCEEYGHPIKSMSDLHESDPLKIQYDEQIKKLDALGLSTYDVRGIQRRWRGKPSYRR